jgi:hypothetical protein
VAVQEAHEVQDSQAPVPAPTLPDEAYDEIVAALVEAAERLSPS